MLYSQYIQHVSKTNADISSYTQIGLEDEHFRMLLVKELLTNVNINVYYHTYILLTEISKLNGEILLPYLSAFTSLLGHKNSYHRNYGMHLIALMSEYIDDQSMHIIMQKFSMCLYDEKISTRKYCMTYISLILCHHKELRHDLIPIIIASLKDSKLPIKHEWLLMKTFMQLIEDHHLEIDDNTSMFFTGLLDKYYNDKYKKEISKFMKRMNMLN